MDNVFHALSDDTRRQMLRNLAQRSCSISELAEPFPMTLAAASKHVRVLEKAGLVRREVQWRTHVCHLEAAPLKQALDELAFYESFWTNSLDTLDRLMGEEAAETASRLSSSKPTDGGEK